MLNRINQQETARGVNEANQSQMRLVRYPLQRDPDDAAAGIITSPSSLAV